MSDEPILAVYAARITVRGTGTAPTLTELEAAIEKAVEDLGMVSRANQPLLSVNAEATRTDQ
jgi:hypothetical protein